MIYHNIQENSEIDYDRMVGILCDTAKKGLSLFYDNPSGSLPYAARFTHTDGWKNEGFSVRYAAISQIGLARWAKYHSEEGLHMPNLMLYIVENFKKINNIGDLALALWAGLESNNGRCELFAEALSQTWQKQQGLCNAVELGWIVQACAMAVKQRKDLQYLLGPVLDEAKEELISLFRPQTNLFQRHCRSGLKECISRRIACFADQVYPVLALSTYGNLYEDTKAVEIAALVTDRICSMQGPLGQWWWHYDVQEGKVCEEYPVFSVHQDAMAPMAIMANDKVNGKDHSRQIERGLRWLFGENELGERMVDSNCGIIWRDMEKKEPAKLSRELRSIACLTGPSRLHQFIGKCILGFRINRECRPYHLGWILYAWADYSRSQ